MSEPARRPRRWFALSLRGMLVLILVLGVLVGWRARRAHRQRRAVATIRALNGHVVYDWQPRPVAIGGGPGLDLGEPPGPAWLRRLLGDEYFQEVVEVGDAVLGSGREIPFFPPLDAPRDGPEWRAFDEAMRRNRQVEEALDRDQLACLEGLDRLETLTLVRPPLGSEGLARLGRLANLRGLDVSWSPMGAAGLAEVAKLSQLERLSIKLRLPGDAPLALLERLPRLQSLTIEDGFDALGTDTVDSPKGSAMQGTPVNDAWLARIGRLGSLQSLSINSIAWVNDAWMAQLERMGQIPSPHPGEMSGIARADRITDAGLAHLGNLKQLRSLDLGASGIGDAGLAHIGKLGRLEDLHLSAASKVTDVGVASLGSLPNLAWLQLESASKLTDAGVGPLAGLPSLQILAVNVRSMSGAGIARLGTIGQLASLKLTGAKVRGEVVDGIKAARPGISVEAARINPGDAPDSPK